MVSAAIGLEQSIDLFRVRCTEPEGEIVRNVRLCRLSFKKIVELYQKASQFDVLFNHHVSNSLENFVNIFLSMDENGEPHIRGLAWEVDDVGLLYLTDIRPRYEAFAHFTFWDRRFRGRERLVRESLRLAFDYLDFQRIAAEVPLYAVSTIKAVERIGFVKEGRKRKSVLYKGEWFDTLLYSVLKSDLGTAEEENGR